MIPCCDGRCADSCASANMVRCLPSPMMGVTRIRKIKRPCTCAALGKFRNCGCSSANKSQACRFKVLCVRVNAHRDFQRIRTSFCDSMLSNRLPLSAFCVQALWDSTLPLSNRARRIGREAQLRRNAATSWRKVCYVAGRRYRV
jgi:hypothetical protein